MNLQQTGYLNTLVKLGIAPGVQVPSAKEMSKIEATFARGGRMPTWLKWGLPVGAVAGGGYLASKLWGRKQPTEIPSEIPEEFLYQQPETYVR